MKRIVTLRPPREGDAAIHFEHAPEAEIVRMFGGDPDNLRKPSLTWSENWVAWLREHRFGQVILADGTLVGEVRLHHFDDTDNAARLAIGLFSTGYLNQGIGRQAIQQTLTIAFNDFKLKRVDLRVLAFNTRAIRCYQACGFTHIGTEQIDIRGKPADEWTMSCENRS